MVQHILVALDGSPLAETILPYVGALARGTGATVTLLHVAHIPKDLVHPEGRAALEHLARRLEPRAQEYLAGVGHRLEEQGLTVQQVVTAGDAATEILRVALEQRADIVALATHGRSGLQRWLYGSVADAVLHRSPLPVLLVRPRGDGTAAIAPIQQILVPLDGSEAAEAALPLAQHLATHLHVPLTLLQAVEAPVYTYLEPELGMGTDYQDIFNTVRTVTEQYLTRMAEQLRASGVEVQAVAPIAFPTVAIVQYSHDHPGTLTVMATHGRTGVGAALLGSVARRVVQEAGSPVLLVRPLA